MNFRNSITKFRHFNTIRNNNRIMYITAGANDNDLKLGNLENEIDKLKNKNFKLIMKIKDIQNQLNHINNNRFIEVYKEIHKFQDFKKN